jgi:hypothetical protein
VAALEKYSLAAFYYLGGKREVAVQIADIGGIAISSEGTGYLSRAHNIIPGFVGVRDAL